MTASHTVLDLVRDDIRALEAYQIPHPPGIRAKLDANENPWSLPEDVAAELAKVIARVPLNRYPDGHASALRAHVAAAHNVSPMQLSLGNGSDELIALVVTAFSKPRPGGGGKARIAWPVPSFVVYRTATFAAGCAPLETPLRADFTFDDEKFERNMTAGRPNVVFFAWPNNPTGTLWPREALLKIIEKHADTLFVSDEAYFDYSGETMLDVLAKHPNLIVMRTFSKLGLAALRCGYIVADEKIIHEVEKIRPPYNVGAVNQAAALWLIQHHRELLEDTVARVVAERERLLGEMAKIADVTTFATKTNFILFRYGEPGDGRATQLWQRLIERGVLVRNFDRPGPLLGCLRVNVGTPEENELFLEALRA